MTDRGASVAGHWRIVSMVALLLFTAVQAVEANSDTSWRKDWKPNADWTDFPGEIGDAVYRGLKPDEKLQGFGHAAIVVGWNELDQTMMFIQASGYGHNVEKVTWNGFMDIKSNETDRCSFWGVRTHPKGVDTHKRNEILARAYNFLGVWYDASNPWLPPGFSEVQKGFHRYTDKPATLRCDGLVELAYEWVDRDPVFFAPAAPQNQANDLVAAVFENPVFVASETLTSNNEAAPQELRPATSWKGQHISDGYGIPLKVNQPYIPMRIRASDKSSGIGLVKAEVDIMGANKAWVADQTVKLQYETAASPTKAGDDTVETWKCDLTVTPGATYRVKYHVYDKVHHHAASEYFYFHCVK